MNNNDIIQESDELQGKKSSLWHLTNEKAIAIPIIQRDYAQGRTNDEVRQIREPFLKKIFKVLDDCDEKLELDFIYGSLEKPKDISLKRVDYENFVPLDGQQRLTTLFLLHWFLALWNENDFDLMRDHFKGRFAYVTRLSSSEFCSELLEHVCSQDVVCSILNDAQKKPVSRVLKNEGWFHNQWENDPTISGMLTMLDTMAFLFCDSFSNEDKTEKARRFFKRLACDNVEDAAITFNLLYLNRGDFHLSDELYIKMNSRGKPLSDFEAFKARFESFIEKHANVGSDFAGKIDGEWADVFWNLRNNVKPKSEDDKKEFYRDNTDGMMMNVIKVVLANQFAILAEDNDNGLDELFESQIAKKANPEMHLTFYRYTELGVFNEMGEDDCDEETGIDYVAVCQSVYDAFSFIYDIKKHPEKYQIDSAFMDVDGQLDNILFYGIDGKNSKITGITYQTRLMFWALSAYCIKYRENIHNCEGKRYLPLNRWMRFVRNMVEATEINNVSDMQKALKFLNSAFDEMKDGDIISYLSEIKGASECPPFPQSQIKEEILKAQLISSDATWEEIITNADNVTFWPGRSGYLLYFSGLSNISYQDICQWKPETHKNNQGLFDTYKQKMDKLLSYLDSTNFKENCLLERAMLSKGNYFRKEGKDSIIYSMMDQSINSRSYSFRQMVQFNGIDCNDDDSIYKEGVVFLQKVLDDPRFQYSNKAIVEESLRNIINDSLGQICDWRWPLVCDPRIWHESEQRFMWIKDDVTAWVVRKKGGATNQYETWSYYICLLLADEGLRFGYYPHSNPRNTFLHFNVDNQKYRLSIRHKSSGGWQFTMEAVDENYQLIEELDSEMRKVISEMMLDGKEEFVKDGLPEAIQCAKDMQQRIKDSYELL